MGGSSGVRGGRPLVSLVRGGRPLVPLGVGGVCAWGYILDRAPLREAVS